ncbi:DNA damage-responsive protein 48 [Madurella fahalii]|uniref:DNA damage-responsive protein 48 n=1 Tax=Madurella fahalii TaxID=1157608 RepID=A0ABQ0GNQ8_9PEZI
MDFINKMTGQATGNQDNKPHSQGQQRDSSGSSSLMDKLHGLAGGGPESEKKEDALDKGIDWVQENILKQGPQNNENAAEQAKDRFIADAIRGQYQKGTGKDFPGKKEEEKKSSGFGGLFSGN